jgi:hypothetical protein
VSTATLLLVSSLLTLPPAATAQDEEPDIEFFYPVVTRRPVIERELELRTRSAKSTDGSAEHDFVGAIEYPILPWWQVEIEVPVVISNPSEGPSNAGFGDVTIENKFRLWKSVPYRTLVAAGFELTLPSGSASRGLGGAFAIEPFVTAGIALGPFDIIGELHYEWQLNNPDGEAVREQELAGNLAVGYRLHRLFTPFVELNTVVLTRTDDPFLRGATQVYLTPGFNVRPLPGMTFRAGVQLPVTGEREFKWVVHTGLVWEF